MQSKNSDKLFFISNPVAGSGLANRRWKIFKEQLSKKRISFEYQLTVAPKDATRIAKRVIDEGYRKIAVFGGDGTVNEVLQGVMVKNRAPNDLRLILIPAGSSCDFAKKYLNKKTAIELILSQQTALIDIGKIQCYDSNRNLATNYFINNSSIGVISAANEKFSDVSGVAKQIKRLSVDAVAVLSGLKAIIKFTPLTCEIKFDEEEKMVSQITNLTVFKTPYFGGGMYYNVKVKQDDGVLKAATVNSTSKFKLLKMFPDLYFGKIFNNKEAIVRDCTKISIDTNRNFYIEMDGESAGYPPAKYSVLKQALNITI